MILAGFAAFATVTIFTGTVEAQGRARGKFYTKAQVEAVIRRVEERTDNFVSNFDESLDNSGLDGTEREDRLMDRARDLERATDELRREFDRRDRWIENRPEVRKCINIASDIDRTMKNRRLGPVTEANWTKLKYELNTLAKIYELPKVGSGSYR